MKGEKSHMRRKNQLLQKLTLILSLGEGKFLNESHKRSFDTVQRLIHIMYVQFESFTTHQRNSSQKRRKIVAVGDNEYRSF